MPLPGRRSGADAQRWSTIDVQRCEPARAALPRQSCRTSSASQHQKLAPAIETMRPAGVLQDAPCAEPALQRTDKMGDTGHTEHQRAGAVARFIRALKGRLGVRHALKGVPGRASFRTRLRPSRRFSARTTYGKVLPSLGRAGASAHGQRTGRSFHPSLSAPTQQLPQLLHHLLRLDARHAPSRSPHHPR